MPLGVGQPQLAVSVTGGSRGTAELSCSLPDRRAGDTGRAQRTRALTTRPRRGCTGIWDQTRRLSASAPLAGRRGPARGHRGHPTRTFILDARLSPGRLQGLYRRGFVPTLPPLFFFFFPLSCFLFLLLLSPLLCSGKQTKWTFGATRTQRPPGSPRTRTRRAGRARARRVTSPPPSSRSRRAPSQRRAPGKIAAKVNPVPPRTRTTAAGSWSEVGTGQGCAARPLGAPAGRQPRAATPRTRGKEVRAGTSGKVAGPPRPGSGRPMGTRPRGVHSSRGLRPPSPERPAGGAAGAAGRVCRRAQAPGCGLRLGAPAGSPPRGPPRPGQRNAPMGDAGAGEQPRPVGPGPARAEGPPRYARGWLRPPGEAVGFCCRAAEAASELGSAPLCWAACARLGRPRRGVPVAGPPPPADRRAPPTPIRSLLSLRLPGSAGQETPGRGGDCRSAVWSHAPERGYVEPWLVSEGAVRLRGTQTAQSRPQAGRTISRLGIAYFPLPCPEGCTKAISGSRSSQRVAAPPLSP